MEETSERNKGTREYLGFRLKCKPLNQQNCVEIVLKLCVENWKPLGLDYSSGVWHCRIYYYWMVIYK